MKTWQIAAAAALAIFGIAAVAQQEPQNRFEPAAAIFSRVPARARALRNSLATDRDAPRAGRKLFEQHCAQCHGRAAEGAPRGPSLRDPQVLAATPGEIFWVVTNGEVRHGMPEWAWLPEQQRWQIVTYLLERPDESPRK